MTGIAVIIPCYDLGRTVEESLRSVREQTHPAAEIVIIDDGSEDVYTQQVLSRVRASGTSVARTANQGVAAARNLGIRLTSSPYIVLLDADDLLEPTYLEKAAGILDARQDIEFVTCAIQAFEGASYTWCPPPCNLIETLTRGGPHISTMFRRGLWERVGGFDEKLPGYEDTDFWIGALKEGCRGEVLEELLLRYRVRNSSRYHRAIMPTTYVSTMRAIYQKHRELVDENRALLLAAKDAFIVEQQSHTRHLETTRAELEQELAALREQITSASQQLRDCGIEPIDWGDLRRLTPIRSSRDSNGGKPVDSYYVERFLGQHRSDIRGHVLEIKSRFYTELFGSSSVTHTDVLDFKPTNTTATIIDGLTKADAIPTETYDCFILPQILHTIYDFHAGLREAYRILKPGGVLLCSVPCVSTVSAHDGSKENNEDFWRFTEASARKVFSEVFPVESFEVTSYGNVMVYAAILQRLTTEDLTPGELDEVDPMFPALCCVRAVKPSSSQDNEARKRKMNRAAVSSTTSEALGGAAILFYHRIARLVPDTNGLCVTPADFRDHMRHLREHYQPMVLHELAAAATSGDTPTGAVAVTLDDGYLDNLTTASAILSEFDIPATFFITTERIEEEHEFWWDTLEKVFLSGHVLPPMLDLYKNGRWVRSTETEKERAAAHKALVELVYPLSQEDRQAAISRVADWSGLDLSPRSTHRPMTADEVRRLAAYPGHTIGAHTISHLCLPLQPVEIQRREILENKACLERLVGYPVRVFSYPYGEVNKQTLELVSAAKFEFAVTVEGRMIGCGANPLLLPRFEVKGCGVENFAQLLRTIIARSPEHS